MITKKPSMAEVMQYKNEIGIREEYKELADEFVNYRVSTKLREFTQNMVTADGRPLGRVDSSGVMLVRGVQVDLLSYTGADGVLKHAASLVEDTRYDLLKALLITDNGDEEEFRNSEYPDVWLLVNNWEIKGNLEDIDRLIQKFLQQHVVLPNVLMDRYQFIRKQEMETNYSMELEKKTGSDFQFFNGEWWLLDECLRNTWTDRPLEISVMLAKTLGHLKEHGLKSKDTLKRMVDACCKEVFCVKIGEIERYATKSEIKSLVSGVYRKRIYYIEEEKCQSMYALWWMVSGDNSRFRASNLSYSKETLEILEDNFMSIMLTLNWLRSDAFLKEDVPNMLKGAKEIEYPDSVEESMQLEAHMSTKEMLKFIKANVDRADSYGALAYDIAAQCLKDKKYHLSEKQLRIIQRQYDNITGKKKIEISREVLSLVKELRQEYWGKMTPIGKDILEHVERTGRCSEKQENALKYELSKCRKNDSRLMTGVERGDGVKRYPLADYGSRKPKSNAEDTKVAKEKNGTPDTAGAPGKAGASRNSHGSGGVKPEDLNIDNAAKVFGISFSVEDISRALGSGVNGS